MRRVWAALCAAGILWLASAAGGADAPAEATVTDAEGKEVKVTGLKFGAGTRRLAWLADPAGTTEVAKKGPLALEVREPHSTTYKQGVVTLVPLSSVESIHYDPDKKLARVAVKGRPEPLAGTLQYEDLNAFSFSGTAGGKATVFRGWPPGKAGSRANVKAVAFPGAAPLPPRKGTAAWQVQLDQPKAMNPTVKVGEVKFLYQLRGAEALADSAAVRKGEPLRFDAALKSFTPLAVDPNMRVLVAEVVEGDRERVAVVPLAAERDGKPAVLVGLLAEADAGWKFFPFHTIKGMKRVQKD